jgi:hypothetical protein
MYRPSGYDHTASSLSSVITSLVKKEAIMHVLTQTRPILGFKLDPITDMPFKTCNMCQKTWLDAESFITDPSLKINGYQAYFDIPEDGLILFTHKAKGCGSTLAVPAGVFKPLHRGQKYLHRKNGTDVCAQHCNRVDDLDDCHAECEMRWVRDVLHILRNHRLS